MEPLVKEITTRFGESHKLALDIYIRQGVVAKDYVAQVVADKASLDDLPYRAPLPGGLGQAEIKLNQAELDKVLKRHMKNK
jgi:hypothetical protein